MVFPTWHLSPQSIAPAHPAIFSYCAQLLVILMLLWQMGTQLIAIDALSVESWCMSHIPHNTIRVTIRTSQMITRVAAWMGAIWQKQLSELFAFKNWIIIVCAALSRLFLHLQALKLFPALVIVPTMQISWTLFSIISGLLYFEEYRMFNYTKGVIFAMAIMVGARLYCCLKSDWSIAHVQCTCAVYFYPLIILAFFMFTVLPIYGLLGHLEQGETRLQGESTAFLAYWLSLSLFMWVLVNCWIPLLPEKRACMVHPVLTRWNMWPCATIWWFKDMEIW